jgi:hypothetical protein
MKRPEIRGRSLVYLSLMARDQGETGITGMIERCAIFAWKEFISRPQKRHYEAIANKMLSEAAACGGADNQ